MRPIEETAEDPSSPLLPQSTKKLMPAGDFQCESPIPVPLAPPARLQPSASYCSFFFIRSLPIVATILQACSWRLAFVLYSNIDSTASPTKRGNGTADVLIPPHCFDEYDYFYRDPDSHELSRIICRDPQWQHKGTPPWGRMDELHCSRQLLASQTMNGTVPSTVPSAEELSEPLDRDDCGPRFVSFIGPFLFIGLCTWLVNRPSAIREKSVRYSLYASAVYIAASLIQDAKNAPCVVLAERLIYCPNGDESLSDLMSSGPGWLGFWIPHSVADVLPAVIVAFFMLTALMDALNQLLIKCTARSRPERSRAETTVESSDDFPTRIQLLQKQLIGDETPGVDAIEKELKELDTAYQGYVDGHCCGIDLECFTAEGRHPFLLIPVESVEPSGIIKFDEINKTLFSYYALIKLCNGEGFQGANPGTVQHPETKLDCSVMCEAVEGVHTARDRYQGGKTYEATLMEIADRVQSLERVRVGIPASRV